MTKGTKHRGRLPTIHNLKKHKSTLELQDKVERAPRNRDTSPKPWQQRYYKNSNLEEYVAWAKAYYRLSIIVSHAFPTPSMTDTMAKDAYLLAADRLHEKRNSGESESAYDEPTQAMIRLVSDKKEREPSQSLPG